MELSLTQAEEKYGFVDLINGLAQKAFDVSHETTCYRGTSFYEQEVNDYNIYIDYTVKYDDFYVDHFGDNIAYMICSYTIILYNDGEPENINITIANEELKAINDKMAQYYSDFVHEYYYTIGHKVYRTDY